MKVLSAHEANPKPDEDLLLSDKNQSLNYKPEKSLGEIGLSQFVPYLMNGMFWWQLMHGDRVLVTALR